MIHSPSRPGYVFLLSVLVIGAIATATTVTLLLLGNAAERNAFSLWESTQAMENARTCAERSLLTLRQNLAYAGSSQVSLTDGSCSVVISGNGVDHRAVCVEGRRGTVVRRLELEIDRLFPTPQVSSWKEVPAFSLCQ